MRNPVFLLLAAAFCISPPGGVAAESWWPQFRGPNACGVSESADPPMKFGPGEAQLWKVPVPSGASSPCVWRDRIFLTGFENGRLFTLCYDRRDGKLLWKQNAHAEKIEEFHQEEGSPAASTPATDGRRVVSYFGSCGLICHNLEGKELWRHVLPVARTVGGFGSGASPIIAGGLVIVNRDQAAGCSLLAVDLKTGKTAWETQRPDVSQSFGTPVLWKDNHEDEIVMSGSLKLKGYNLKTGAERWSLDHVCAFTCTTPVVGNGLLISAAWAPGREPNSYPTFESLAAVADKNHDGVITEDEAKAAGFGAYFRAMDANNDGKITAEDLQTMSSLLAKGENVMVAVKPGGHGNLEADRVAWKQTGGLPYVASPLFYRDRVYLVRDGGMVSCFDATTGAPIYQKERLGAEGSYYTSPVAAAGRIYCASVSGRVTVFAAGGDTPNILHHADFGERINATPALVEHWIYLRTASSLYAFGP